MDTERKEGGAYKGHILAALRAVALERRSDDLLGEAHVTDSLGCLIGELFGGGEKDGRRGAGVRRAFRGTPRPRSGARNDAAEEELDGVFECHTRRWSPG